MLSARWGVRIGQKDQFRAHKSTIPLICHLLELIKKVLVDMCEIEAGFPLHSLLQPFGDSVQQIREDVYRHQVVRDIPLAHLHTPEPDFSTAAGMRRRADQGEVSVFVGRVPSKAATFVLRDDRSEPVPHVLEWLARFFSHVASPIAAASSMLQDNACGSGDL